MLKKLLKAGTTVTLLLGCYFAYVRAFDIIVNQYRSERPDDDLLFPIRNSRSKQHAQELASLAFGPNHWTVTSDQPYAYYNSERGFWMFALDVKEIQEENGVRYDGKRLRMSPFCMISKSSDGKNIMTVTAEEAILDMNQPVTLGKAEGEGLKLLHAHIERNVWIRDDKGTPANPADDMNVGPLTYLDFDDASQQITTESHVDIVDPDQKTSGDGLVIQLRKPQAEPAADPGSPPVPSSSGFGGVEYAILMKNVRVTLRDVGSSGMFPGSPPSGKNAKATGKDVTLAGSVAPASSTAKAASGTPDANEPVPLYIQSDGLMRVDWPPDRLPVAIGPPEPPSPTLVRFERNVVALHGRLDRPDRQPNQLDCDTLRLTLVPAGPPPGRRDKDKDKDAARPDAPAMDASKPQALAQAAPAAGQGPGAAPVVGASGGVPNTASAESKYEAGTSPPADAAASAPDGKSKGLFGNLTLQKAHATGHAVWLQLREQGSKILCNELVHDRRLPYQPDSTTFRADRSRKIWLQKIDYEKPDTDLEAARTGQPAQPAAIPLAQRKVSSVTHVITASATLFDRGHGVDLADIRAYGPGRLETRPDLKEPVEQIANWQDELIVVNIVDENHKLRQKQVTLTGTRPEFLDLPKQTRLVAAREIKVFLKPQSPEPAPPAGTLAQNLPASAPATASAATFVPDPFVGTDVYGATASTPSPMTSTPGPGSASADSGLGGSLQIERLVAFKDVHFTAPNRKMEAREWLDAPFVEVDPPPPDPATKTANEAEEAGEEPGEAGADARTPGAAGEKPAGADKAPAAAGATPAAKAAEPTAEKEAEPGMTGVADRIWAKIGTPRGKGLTGKKSRRKSREAAPAPAAVAMASAWTAGAAPAADAAAPTQTAAADDRDKNEPGAEVKEAWLRGNVALHQDVPPDPEKANQPRPKGNDVFGEAVYLDNRGKGKIFAKVYYRDPTEEVHKPGPMPWAKVSTDDMTFRGEILWMDQEHDMVWGYGPGSIYQWTDRALMTDKSPAGTPAAEVPGTATARTGTGTAAAGMPTPGVRTVQGTGLRVDGPAAQGPAGEPGRSATVPVRTATATSTAGRAGAPASRSTLPGSQPADKTTTASATTTKPRPRTRAGKLVGDKDLLTITWTERMQFNGRTKDPLGRPSGRGDFYGIVHAEMTDAVLHCEQKMYVFTDREVPLANLDSARPGKRSRSAAARQPETDDQDGAAENAPPAETQADLALIYCYGQPVAVSRKIDPDTPVVLEKQKIVAWDREDTSRKGGDSFVPGRLIYNRLTGRFDVPGPGIVYLYDRPEESRTNEDGSAPSGPGNTGATPASGATTSARTPAQRAGTRTVTRTSFEAPGQDGTQVAGRDVARPRAPEPASPPVKRTFPPLVLMQVNFSTGMRGRMGSGQANDTAQTRWSEFFGDIEFLRSKVAHDGVELNPDARLSDDGFYLTSQMMRIIQEPPPPGSPAKTAARTFAKAWERVHVNKGEALSVESDIGTFDSANDVMWFYGEGGRGATILQQVGPGQPLSRTHARAWQYNVKTHAGHGVDSESVIIIDHRTGARPGKAPTPDPTAQPPKKRKTPFRVPNTNLERRGFTGY